jgi:hypothetical protein
MTNPTPLHPAPLAPMAQVSINDDLPTSSPSPRSTLIGLACIIGTISLLVLYWKIIGF